MSKKNKVILPEELLIKNKKNLFWWWKKIKYFFSFFKNILNSLVIREYYKKVESFKNYEFPLDDENIINYLCGKINGAELADNFSGVCNRKGFGIFINRANGKKYIGFEYS